MIRNILFPYSPLKTQRETNKTSIYKAFYSRGYQQEKPEKILLSGVSTREAGEDFTLGGINKRSRRRSYSRGYQQEKNCQHLQGFVPHWLIFPVYIGATDE
jgi:hypothetical protein